MQRKFVWFAALAAGVQALVAQSLLLREELLLYGGNEIAVGTFFGLWLGGVALGALTLRRRAHLAKRLTVPLLLTQGALPLAATLIARTAREMAGIPAYEPFPLLMLLLWTIPVAAPVALCTGALVPSLAAHAQQARGSVTSVYVAESIGSLLGGIAVTLLLVAATDPGALLLGCTAVGGAGAAALVVGNRRVIMAAATACLAIGAVLYGPSMGRLLRQQQLASVLPGAHLLDAQETPGSSLMLAELREQQVFLADGRIIAAFPDPPRVERGAGLLAALTGGPRSLLIVGTEAVDLLPGVLALGALTRVTWVVSDAGIRDFALRHIPGLSTDKRLHIVLGDPVSKQSLLREQGPFDALWLLVNTPTRRADDRYLARETLGRLAQLMTPAAVLAVPVRSAENYVGPRLRLAVGCVVAGVAAALPHVRLVPGEDGLVLGAQQPQRLVFAPTALAAAYRSMAPETDRLDEQAFASLLDPDRVERADALVASLRKDTTVRPSELDRPVALFYNLLVRAEQESDDLARAIEALRQTEGFALVPLAVLALFGLGAVVTQRTSEQSSGAAAVALLVTGGAVSMGLDLLLLHLYQGRFGTLYLEVGWLVGLFVGGLAIGGLVGRRLCRQRGVYQVGHGAIALLVIFCGALGLLGSDLLLNRATGALAFVLAGSLGGVLIPVAEGLLAKDSIVGARAGVGIEAADHFGGMLCALLLGVLGIPILGARQAAVACACVACVGGLALLLSWLRTSRRLPAKTERWLRRATAFRSFPYRRSMLVLLAVCSAAVVGHGVAHRLLLGPRVQLDVTELAHTGMSPPWREALEPVLHYRSGASSETGVALASSAAGPGIHGYGGPINLLVGTDSHGAILHVSFLEHRETPSYVEGAGRFLGALEGKSLLRPIALKPMAADRSSESPSGQSIDAITGATVTSVAIVTALGQAGQRLAVPVYGKPYTGSERAADFTDLRFLYVLASWLLLLPMFLWGGRWLRRGWLLLHAGVGGLWLGVQLSSVQVLAWLRLEPQLDPSAWTGILVLVVAATALLGPLYCGYLCPAGALQELLGQLGLARRLPAAIDGRARFLKYLLLAALVTFVLGFGSTSATRLDLLREVWAEHRSHLGLALLVVVAAGSLITVRFGCRYLCPTGALLNLLGKVAPLRRLLPPKDYGACDLGVRGLPDVDCLQCNRCLLGERIEPAAAWRLWAFGLALGGALLLLLVTVIPSVGDNGGDSVAPQVRPFNQELIQARIRGRRLSGKRAEYWHVIRP